MSECDAQIFSNITRERWVGMQSKAAQIGIELVGNSGQETKRGIYVQLELRRRLPDVDDPVSGSSVFCALRARERKGEGVGG